MSKFPANWLNYFVTEELKTWLISSRLWTRQSRKGRDFVAGE